jgi:HK97 gp10 family phage protein
MAIRPAVKVTLKFVSKFDKAKKKLCIGVSEGLRLAGAAVLEQAVHLADFKKGYQTGRLRNSLSYCLGGQTEGANKQAGAKAGTEDLVKASNTETTVNIGTSVEYAASVEYGTSKMEAQMYLRPAVDIMQPKIEKFLRGKLREVCGK